MLLNWYYFNFSINKSAERIGRELYVKVFQLFPVLTQAELIDTKMVRPTPFLKTALFEDQHQYLSEMNLHFCWGLK